MAHKFPSETTRGRRHERSGHQAGPTAIHIAHDLVGADHGGVGVCVIFVDAAPGAGAGLHKHPYEELFTTLEGEATFVAGDEEMRPGPGDIVIVPPGTPHGSTNSGDGRLRQIDIHVSPTFTTEWR